jgi:hypothetical protein
MNFDWLEFCALVRSIPEVTACADGELHRMLTKPTPPSRQTNEVGAPLSGSSLINEHPDPASYRRVMDVRCRGCVEDGDEVGANYHVRLVQFLESHPEGSGLFIVDLSTSVECYEFLYIPVAKAALFSPVRHLEGRKMKRT